MARHKIKKLADEFISEAKKRGRNLDRYQRRLLIAEIEKTADLTATTCAPWIAGLMAEYRKKMPSLAKTSHIRALAEQPIPTLRAEALNKLDWSLFVGDDGSFILGDIGPLCKSLESGSFEYLPKNDDTHFLMLPISHNRAIIGSVKGLSSELNPDEVNEASAAFSSKFFISARDSDKERSYWQVLGSKSMILSRDETAKILQETILDSESLHTKS
jgi:hypothetical protein